MANELKIFENPAFGSIRTVEMDGAPFIYNLIKHIKKNHETP